MRSSKEVNELFAALAKAQGEMEVASKDATNPYYGSNFASYKSMILASRPHLSKNGLAVTQPPVRLKNGIQILETILGHSSGQWISSTIELKPRKKATREKPELADEPDDGPQAFGSCITFMKRYAYASIVGIALEDDDGEAAEGRTHTKTSFVKPAASFAPKGDIVTEDMLKSKLIGNINAKAILAKYKTPRGEAPTLETVKWLDQSSKKALWAELNVAGDMF